MFILTPLLGRLFLNPLKRPRTPNLLEPCISLVGDARYEASDPVRIMDFLFKGAESAAIYGTLK